MMWSLRILRIVLAGLSLLEIARSDDGNKTVEADTAGNITAPREVCYPLVGCFNNDPPFNNANDALPQHPNQVNTQFQLHTREQRDTPHLLDYILPDTIKHSHFNGSRPTKFITHGFTSNSGARWVVKIWNALLDVGDYNVVAINWTDGASFFDYTQAVANVRLVATQIRVLLQLLQRIHGLDLNDVHLIGHSLGAQISGYASALLGSQVGRVTGLDPADPNFQYLPRAVRLDPTDAKFVDVIHSNGMEFGITVGLGVEQRTGHVDFMMNGGMKQPGCTDGVDGTVSNFWGIINGASKSLGENFGAKAACSHSRACYYFAESINSTCKFRSMPCESYEKYERGECTTCGEQGCSEMGFYATDYPEATGRQYLNTFDIDEEPFCGANSFHLRLTPTESQKKTKGEIKIRLTNKDKSPHSRWFDIFGRDTNEIGDKVVDKMVAVDKSFDDLGDDAYVELEYTRRTGLFGFFSQAAREFNIENIELTNIHTGTKYSSKSGATSIKDKTPYLFVLKSTTD